MSINRPALPTTGRTPDEQRLVSGLGDLVRSVLNSGAFLRRIGLGPVAHVPSGKLSKLDWGTLNRIAPQAHAVAVLPRARPEMLGVPLTVCKQTWQGVVSVLPTTSRFAGISGISAVTLTRPGLYQFVTDGQQWFQPAPEHDVDVTTFGASPLAAPSVNDAAFQNAAEAARLRGGGVLYIPAGNYRKLATLYLGENVQLAGDGDSSTLDYSGVTATTIGIVAQGSQATGVALAGNAAEGSDDLNVSGSGFTTGDFVKVYSSAVTGSTSVPKGEICRINDATTMTLYDPLCDSYATADTASVAKLTLQAGNAFRNFKIVGPADNSVTFSGILCDYTIGARFENITTERCHFYGIAVEDSIDVEAVGCQFSKSESGALAYGFAIFNACQDVTLTCLRGYRLRHLVTHGGFTTRNGVPRRTTTSASVASQARNSGFDAHAGGEDITFEGCHVLGSESDGFTLECASAKAIGCTVRDSVGPGFHLNTESSKPYRITLAGCEVSGKGNVATRSAVQIQVSTGFESFDGITISGGNFADCRYGLRTINAETGRIENLTISGATFKNCGLDADAVIQVTHAQGVTVSGCTINDSTNSVDGVSLTDVLDFSVTGNTIRLPGTGGCRGVRCLTTASDGVIEGNEISAGSSGIGVGLADTCSNITVGPNHLRGCPTPLSLGAGTGHRLIQGEALTVRGDVGVTLTESDDYSQLWNTTLSNNRTIGIPTGNVRMGFHLARGPGASGAFNLQVGSGSASGALHIFTGTNQWCRIASTGSGFMRTGAGFY